MVSQYEPVIGLEVHVQLKTASKMFCRCLHRFGAEPNTLICPVCLGYPGALPVVNKQAVNLAVTLALALGCEIQERSIFARKSYFYPDLPKGYQITQMDPPLGLGGYLPLARHDRRIRIHRLHLEEDAGKLLHEAPGGGPLDGASLVDYNRSGAPLVEIVSEPDLRSAAEAQDYLQTLRRVLLYTATSDANMEEGSLRCDANISLRPRGSDELGTKAEVKNLNSFRHVARALEFEAQRQENLLRQGRRIIQETRTFDASAGVTRSMRSKEEAHDYRYFPEPDLEALTLAPKRVEALGRELPELPWERYGRFVSDFGLPPEDARVLTATSDLADYFEAAVAAFSGDPRKIANWIRTEILRQLKERRLEPAQALAPGRLAALAELVDSGELSSSAAKTVLGELWTTDSDPRQIAQDLGLVQVRDTEQLEAWVRQVLAEHPEQAARYRAGKHQLAGFFVGQIMRLSSGRADPRLVQDALQRQLQ